MEALQAFNPVAFTLEENEFLLANLGKPPIVALRDIPKNVIIAAVRPVLDRVYELEQLKEHRGATWVGLGAIKDAIQIYLREAAKWANDKRRGAPRFPSMCSYDSKNRPHLGGIGADSGTVKTYFDAQGNRKPFEVNLMTTDPDAWSPDWVGSPKELATGGIALVSDNTTANRLECGVCGHTESYNADSRQSWSAARGRLAKHLLKATKDTEKHREAHASEFAS